MFYHAIILPREKARNFYELLNNVDCPMTEIKCPFCSYLYACNEFRKILNDLEEYLGEREEE